MPHPIMFDDADPFLIRVREVALTLPDATEVVAHGRPTFRCGKMFGNYGGGEKGGIRHDRSVLFLADPVERAALVEDPRFFVPAYFGPAGWLGILLDDATDWIEVAELLDASYRQIAPKRSLAKLDAREAGTTLARRHPLPPDSSR
ncbi:MmcQ/YjbR family DNA-binding protein [Gordonia polyisoprenivorans]|uniref:MmcQ/YjbR family DNA-binding protein n=1 Tax=Gordonia polyisoprenivorans TaxID=84595 RepID=UPI001AD635B7|nr:MmcQ/YjbR family DNA-binding protein [Gordonia polyisoprenivorans]QTI67788.1 MmcQ/YjbR family DNA-binding protein [Gordonia polyisoprenivorans]